MFKNSLVVVIVGMVLFLAGTAFGTIWNVDFECNEGNYTYKQPMVGPGPDGGVGEPGDYWNVFDFSEDGTGTPVGIGLVDSKGNAGGVSLTFTSADGSDRLGAFGHSPDAVNALVGEYLFLGNQNTTYNADFEITGLGAGASCDMYLWTGGPVFGSYSGNNMSCDITLDMDGDGSLAGEAPLTILEQAAPTIVRGIIADGSGTIHGRYSDNGGMESELSGFQLTCLPVIVESNGPIILNEDNETTDVFTVKLTGEPGSDVTITLDPSNNQNDFRLNSEGAGDPLILSFTPSNWDSPQTVTIGAVDDVYEEGQENCEIDFIVSSSDPSYNGISVTSVTFDVLDNDRAGDINRDGVIDLGDLFVLLDWWLDDC